MGHDLTLDDHKSINSFGVQSPVFKNMNQKGLEETSQWQETIYLINKTCKNEDGNTQL